MATAVEVLRQKASDAKDAYAAEFAKYNEDNLPTEDQEKHVDDLREAMTSAHKELTRAEGFLGRNNDPAVLSFLGQKPNPARQSGGTKPKLSMGAEFTENPSYQDWLRQVAPNGKVPDKARLSSPSFEFKGMADLDRRSALITGVSDSSAGAFVLPDYYNRLVELGRRPLSLRQMVTNLTTQSDTVEYTREVSQTIAASVVAEATATSGSSGVKPESSLTYEKETTSVKTIAHWIPATRRALSDASQIRGLIDAFLRYGLEYALEEEMMSGDGTGEHFDGILNTTGTQTQAWDTDLFVTLRKAKRKVRYTGRAIPTAYVLHPEDWERIELSKDNQNRFYGSGPFGETDPSVWRLPVIESESIPVGTGLCGAFNWAVLWDREQATLSVSDSHQDFFIRNLIAILAELRAAFGVLKPAAFCEIDLTA